LNYESTVYLAWKVLHKSTTQCKVLSLLLMQIGGINQTSMSSTTASQEELKAHRVPLAWRDQCSAYVYVLTFIHAHDYLSRKLPHPPLFESSWPFAIRMGSLLLYTRSLLLPLNVCRKEKYYLPWECENERHAYEKYVGSTFIFFHPSLTFDLRLQVSIRRVGFPPHFESVLSAFGVKLYSQDESAIKAETPRERGRGLMID